MKKMFINVEASRTQVIVSRDGEMCEYYIEPATADKLVGNMYKGKVINILQGMKAAFVSLGLERNGFLDVGGILLDKSVLSYEDAGNLNNFDIKEGDEVLCQIMKEPFGTKGARITLNISIPGRFLVFSPVLKSIGISKKIQDEDAKKRLLELVEKHRGKEFGYIVRTASEKASDEEIIAEIEYLEKEWEKIQNDYKNSEINSLIYNDGDLIKRTLRDMLSLDIDEVITNSESLYEVLQNNEIYKRYRSIFTDLLQKLKLC